MTQEAGPPDVFEAIKAFKEAQEQRVNHWKEYDEAIALYQTHQQQYQSSDTSNGTEGGIVRSEGGASASGNGHYRTEGLPMTDDIFAKILSLVTSGLLDSSHSVRAIETELRTRFHLVALADLVGQVQDLENVVLRIIVQRDQSKRRSMVEGRDINEENVRQEDAAVQEHRQQIQELMAEISAEVAELHE